MTSEALGPTVTPKCFPSLLCSAVPPQSCGCCGKNGSSKSNFKLGSVFILMSACEQDGGCERAGAAPALWVLRVPQGSAGAVTGRLAASVPPWNPAQKRNGSCKLTQSGATSVEAVHDPTLPSPPTSPAALAGLDRPPQTESPWCLKAQPAACMSKPVPPLPCPPVNYFSKIMNLKNICQSLSALPV